MIAPPSGPWLRGRPIVARYARFCAVCNGRIDVGRSIIVASDRRVAHLGCGAPEATKAERRSAREEKAK